MNRAAKIPGVRWSEADELGRVAGIGLAPVVLALEACDVDEQGLRCRLAGQRRELRFHQGTGQGLTFQIAAAYSAMVRSLENFPEPATFKMALRTHASGRAYRSSNASSASR